VRKVHRVVQRRKVPEVQKRKAPKVQERVPREKSSIQILQRKFQCRKEKF